MDTFAKVGCAVGAALVATTGCGAPGQNEPSGYSEQLPSRESEKPLYMKILGAGYVIDPITGVILYAGGSRLAEEYYTGRTENYSPPQTEFTAGPFNVLGVDITNEDVQTVTESLSGLSIEIASLFQELTTSQGSDINIAEIQMQAESNPYYVKLYLNGGYMDSASNETPGVRFFGLASESAVLNFDQPFGIIDGNAIVINEALFGFLNPNLSREDSIALITKACGAQLFAQRIFEQQGEVGRNLIEEAVYIMMAELGVELDIENMSDEGLQSAYGNLLALRYITRTERLSHLISKYLPQGSYNENGYQGVVVFPFEGNQLA